VKTAREWNKIIFYRFFLISSNSIYPGDIICWFLLLKIHSFNNLVI
jgi:hypothetical protein